MLREEDVTEGAHCPAPVFLVFDAKRMLTRSEALFSDGNLATQSRRAEVEKTAAFFAALPFHTIYHDSAFSAEDAEEIVFRRNAEILFPEMVDLDDLHEIVCRTEPERATLLTLLGSQASNWLPIIRLEREGERTFWGARDTRKSRTLVRDAQLEEGRIILSFATARGPYTARVRVKDIGRAERPLILDEVYTFPEFIGPRLDIPLSVRPRRVALQVRINGCLACQVELDRARLVTTTGRR